MLEKNIHSWLEGDIDEASKAEVRSMDKEALADAFYRKLEFGTGGLRGLMGVGTNRLNIYTVREATQGLANYLKKECSGEIQVLVGFDSRNNSELFAEEAARVLAGNSIHPLLLDGIRPVPLVSFGCRHLGCNAAILITASHNPPEYNGYKVYWSNGGQVLPPHDQGIIAEVNAVQRVMLGELPHNRINIDAAYLEATKPPKPEEGGSLKVVYSSLHGTGITLVPPMLNNWGFSNLDFVEAQCVADGNFPTVKSPNPEEPGALEMGSAQMLEDGADLFIATDPDADRLGVVIHHQGEALPLNGNELACLCLHHLCETRELTPKMACIKTIVTSELFAAIAGHYGLPCFDVLTGFKYIGEMMDEWEASGAHEYLFGAEESYGCLVGTHARDKDAVSASALVCEMALHAKRAGITLIDRLNALYADYGFYLESLISLAFKGKAGAEEMQAKMDSLRNDPPTSFGGIPVESMTDYLGKTNLPKSNVLLWRLADETKLVIRPSGTEPKIKIYIGVMGDDAEARIELYSEELRKMFKN